jgi:HlyD family secretion protein
MKRLVIIVVSLVLLVVVVGGIVAMMGQQRSKAAAAQSEQGVIKVEKGLINLKVVESGTIDAVKAVEVRSRASGRLARLLFDEGDEVVEGDMIAEIDPQETTLQVEQSQAQVRGARSSVARTDLEIRQQQQSLREALAQAQLRLATISKELEIQPTLTRTQIEQADAQLDALRRQRETLVRITHPNQSVDLNRQVAEAQFSFETSKREFERQSDLLNRGYVAQRVVENARLQMQLDQSRLNTATSNLSRLKEQQQLELQRLDEEIRSAQASYQRTVANSIQDVNKRREYQQAVSEVNKARAALLQVPILRQSKAQSQATVDQLSSVLKDSMRQLRETKVRAPFSGVITKRYIEVGDLVTALSTFSSGTAIVRLEDRSRLMVKLEINEIDVARLRPGMKANVEIDALPEMKLTGTVRKIAPASTGIATGAAAGAAQSAEAVVKYKVEIYLDKVVPEIRTGMSAKCSLDVVNKPNVLRIPVAYLGRDNDGAYVMIAPESKTPGAKPTRRPVSVGVSTGAYVEVISGVKEGERLAKPPFNGPARQSMVEVGGGDEE